MPSSLSGDPVRLPNTQSRSTWAHSRGSTAFLYIGRPFAVSAAFSRAPTFVTVAAALCGWCGGRYHFHVQKRKQAQIDGVTEPGPAFFPVPVLPLRVSSGLVTLAEGIRQAGALKITCICLWNGSRTPIPSRAVVPY